MENTNIDLTQIGIAVGTFTVGTLAASSMIPLAPAAACAGVAALAYCGVDTFLRGGGIEYMNQAVQNRSANTFGYFGFMGKSMTQKSAGNAQAEPIQKKLQRLEMQVVNTFAENKIGILQKRRVVVSPKLVTVMVQLASTDIKSINSTLKLVPSLTMRTGQDRIRIYQKGSFICVELPNPQPWIVYGAQIKPGTGVNIPLGYDNENQLVMMDFTKATTAHLGLIGQTGGGKSVAAVNIAYHLARQNHPDKVRFLVIARKIEDTAKPDGAWIDFRALPHTMAVVTDPNEQLQAMFWLHAEMQRRESSQQARKQRIFVFMDDLVAIINAGGDPMKALMEDLTSQGRSLGINMIFGTQAWNDAGVGSSVVKNNVNARIIFGATSAAGASVSAGMAKSGVNKLRGEGDTVFVVSAEQTHVAGAFVLRKDIFGLLQGHPPMPNPYTPWLEDGGYSGGYQGGYADNSGYSANQSDSYQDDDLPVTSGGYSQNNTRKSAKSTVIDNTGYDGYDRLSAAKPPTRVEQAYIRECFAELGSINKVAAAVYGGKNSKIVEYIKMATGE